MTISAKELRFKISLLFDLLSKGEEIVITYRGKAKGRLLPYEAETGQEGEDEIFGMWADRDENVEEMVRSLRKGREF